MGCVGGLGLLEEILFSAGLSGGFVACGCARFRPPSLQYEPNRNTIQCKATLVRHGYDFICAKCGYAIDVGDRYHHRTGSRNLYPATCWESLFIEA